MDNTNYPLPGFHFSVKWSDDDKNISFSEVSGLSVETKVIEYREGSNQALATYKMPGLKTFPKVVLKRGTVANDNGFFLWWNASKLNKPERRPVSIDLLDENHEPVATWDLKECWPSKVSFGTLSAKSNEVLIEELTLECESLEASRPQAK